MGFTEEKPLLHYDAQGSSYFGGNYYYVSAATAGTSIDDTPTYFHRINITTAGSSSVITVKDAKADGVGNIVAVFNGDTALSYELGAHLVKGLYITVTATTAPKFTILYSSQKTGG